MKLAIIGGAGTLGATAAFYVAIKNICNEIVLLDVKENMLKSHVADMEQAVSEVSATKIAAGCWDDLAGSHVVVVTASLPECHVASRNEYLAGNIKIIEAIASRIAWYCPQAVVICCTNPIDVFNYVLYKLTGMKAKQFIGFCRNDSLRLRWAVAKILDLRVADVEGMVLGEHGETQVSLLNSIKVKGQLIALTEEQQSEVEDLIKTWFLNYQALKSGRTTGWTSAIGVATLVEAIASGSPEPVPCSAVLTGEYGIKDVSLGVPVLLGATGVQKVVQISLSEQELEVLQSAANKVKELLGKISLVDVF